MIKKYIVTNFAYGTGPYLRTTELALAFNDGLEKHGRERLGIIVPLVYGERQKKIMLEEFSAYENEIFFDENLGDILKSIFYGNSSYEDALSNWIKNAKNYSEKANKHLSGRFQVERLDGVEMEVDGNNIIVEINRSPRIRYDVAPAYFTTFGYVADILNETKKVDKGKISIRHDLLDKGIKIANWVESEQKIHAVAYPATFSWSKDYKPSNSSEILSPPISRLYGMDNTEMDSGVFVTITGIPGLERLYQEIKDLGLKIYSNDTTTVSGSIRALPNIIPNKNIIFQFARAGWGSIWLSMISKTPLVVPDFDPKDDPEIYFNNLAIENLGIGIIYRRQSLEEVLSKSNELKKNCEAVCDNILSRLGTLDGNTYCARIFVKDFLESSNSNN